MLNGNKKQKYVLRTSNNPQIINNEIQLANVYKKHYSEYSLDVMAWKSWTPAIYDRIHRANYALFAWKFLERPQRWVYKISQKWLELLTKKD